MYTVHRKAVRRWFQDYTVKLQAYSAALLRVLKFITSAGNGDGRTVPLSITMKIAL
jgi:hypothetical protein